MQIICAQCGKQIQKKPSVIKKYQNSFCSKECHSAFMRKGMPVQCSWCGKSFYRSPSLNGFTDLFCSNDCRRKWLGKRNTTILNVKGHNMGHKAPHFTQLNQIRNRYEKIADNPVNVASRVYRPIAEEKLKRKLQNGEVVHHINGIRTDNRPENLQVMTRQEHSRLHMQIAIQRMNAEGQGGDLNVSNE